MTKLTSKIWWGIIAFLSDMGDPELAFRNLGRRKLDERST